MITTTPQDVIKEAKNLLDMTEGNAAKSLAISEDYLQEGKWLHIAAFPTVDGISALDFVDTIESIEIKLRQQFGDEILIVPAKQ